MSLFEVRREEAGERRRILQLLTPVASCLDSRHVVHSFKGKAATTLAAPPHSFSLHEVGGWVLESPIR